jgi:O-acetylserine/cysteine efflux transporter
MLNLPDLLLAVLANVAWGFNFVAGKTGTDHFQPLFFTSIRFFFLLLLMLPWLKPAPGYMAPLLKVAFLLGVVHFGMMFTGLHAGGNIASVAIISQLYVPFSSVLAALVLRERMTLLKIAATCIAFSGVMLIGFDPIVFSHLDAAVWVTGAAFAMGVATILMRQCPNLGVFKLQAWIAVIAAPSLLLLSFLFESGHQQILSSTSLLDFWSPLYSAVGASIVGHGIVYRLVGRHPVSVVTPLLLLTPVLASIFGIFIFGDELGWAITVGGMMTLFGVVLVSVTPGAKTRSGA